MPVLLGFTHNEIVALFDHKIASIEARAVRYLRRSSSTRREADDDDAPETPEEASDRVESFKRRCSDMVQHLRFLRDHIVPAEKHLLTPLELNELLALDYAE